MVTMKIKKNKIIRPSCSGMKKMIAKKINVQLHDELSLMELRHSMVGRFLNALHEIIEGFMHLYEHPHVFAEDYKADDFFIHRFASLLDDLIDHDLMEGIPQETFTEMMRSCIDASGVDSPELTALFNSSAQKDAFIDFLNHLPLLDLSNYYNSAFNFLIDKTHDYDKNSCTQ